ncbi:1-acyl-sn-glycerol-3-phosphate acyltransferase [Desulfosalsimonas propionicica]|uniref:1-acyl-sn-glycerol-3-phosphate acyltransferase n=1 Tax=Desulfosalsimonas propionicica TaxID=332175 RepID=A0A7W0HKL9_9BACT|nr:acyltransferase [Desulfosalsimonas propionicica]MBA2881211.1 1-acyl-sn-glycerol-3-phosphate acyltransferase [Desulfosalsimonas propionicica]
MLGFLPGPLRGAIALLLYTGNTVGAFTTLLPFVILKTLIPHEGTRHFLTRILTGIAWIWIYINSLILRITQDIAWDVQGVDGFDATASYLLLSNHRSWADILVLQHIWKRRIPFLKFFLKRQLIWVPLLGIAWWALDFPFMKRYSKQFIEKHPELKGKDLETTRKYCEKFKKAPISVINFVEGTRFDEKKRQYQNSPYQHLLKPRAGGVATVLSAMGENLEAIIDVTIVYPENSAPLPFWDFLKGKIPRVVMRAKRIEIPKEFVQSGAETDPEFRQHFQDWLNALWDEKDRQITEILQKYFPTKKENP